MYLQNLLKKHPWTFCPQTLTFITCLSKCRIGDVFLFSLSVWDVWRGWWSDDLLLLCSDIVKIPVSCLFWEEIIYCIVPTLRYIFNTKLRWDWTLNSVNFVSNHYWNIYRQIGQNDMKLSCGIYDSSHNLWRILLFCSMPWNLWNFIE